MSGVGSAGGNTTRWNGTAVATPTVAGVPEVDVTHFGGTAGTFASGRPEVNATHLGGTAFATSPGQIKSIQRGVIDIAGAATSATATLSPAVVVAKTELRMLGQIIQSPGTSLGQIAYLVLTNTTTVTATRTDTASGASSTQVSWEITELY